MEVEPFQALLFAADRNVVRPLGVVLASLALVRRRPTEVFVLCDGFTQRDREMLKACAGPSLTLEFIEVPDSLAPSSLLHPDYHLPRATLFRLVFSDLLPTRIKRLLYLDADILVMDDPGLIAVDQDPKVLWAVQDSFRPWIGGPPPLPWQALGIDPQRPYFNAGVLLIDVEMWTDEKVAERTMRLLRERSLPYADQCALNLATTGSWGTLDVRWNVQSAHFRGDKYFANVCEQQEQLVQACTSPGIVHFTGQDKPWRRGVGAAFHDEWFRVLDEGTPWSSWRPTPPPRRSSVRRVVKRLMPGSRA